MQIGCRGWGCGGVRGRDMNEVAELLDGSGRDTVAVGDEVVKFVWDCGVGGKETGK